MSTFLETVKIRLCTGNLPATWTFCKMDLPSVAVEFRGDSSERVRIT